VVLPEGGAVCGVDVRGSSPGTRETDVLDPVNEVTRVHAIVLAGGSAFGLDAACGVVRWLEERGVGYDTGVCRVPIVPAAILFDLRLGDAKIRPLAEDGYMAAEAATAGPVEEGNVGAGAGATVGKLLGPSRAMKSGLGSASVTLKSGLVVAALAAVNAVGDVVDPATGKVIAGVRTEDGTGLADARLLLRDAPLVDWRRAAKGAENTTLAVVATNASLTKVQATKVAQMAQDGVARAVWPTHTHVDGDAVFSLATGRWEGETNVLVVGALGADVVSRAIVRAALSATGVPGFPAARDVGTWGGGPPT
jgi:L-aminopeptidase/D-esterase-like protein